MKGYIWNKALIKVSKTNDIILIHINLNNLFERQLLVLFVGVPSLRVSSMESTTHMHKCDSKVGDLFIGLQLITL